MIASLAHTQYSSHRYAYCLECIRLPTDQNFKDKRFCIGVWSRQQTKECDLGIVVDEGVQFWSFALGQWRLGNLSRRGPGRFRHQKVLFPPWPITMASTPSMLLEYLRITNPELDSKGCPSVSTKAQGSYLYQSPEITTPWTDFEFKNTLPNVQWDS